MSFQPIRADEITPSGQGRSQPMSSEQFQSFAAKGQKQLDGLAAKPRQAPFADENKWNDTVHGAYQASREPWGGQTINPRTSSPVDFNKPDKHAVTRRSPGQDSVRVPAHMNEEQFGSAMGQAKERFHDQLSQPQHYLGVFHDPDIGEGGSIEMDPVHVTQDRGHDEGKGREK